MPRVNRKDVSIIKLLSALTTGFPITLPYRLKKGRVLGRFFTRGIK